MTKRKIPEDKKKFVCPVEGCYSGEGGTAKRCANPAALKNHVRFKHPEEFVALYPETLKEGGAKEGKSFRGGKSGREGETREGNDSREGEEDSFGGWVPL